MRKRTFVAVLAASCAIEAGAQTPLVCYGTEPGWTLDLGDGAARLTLLGEEDVEYKGRATAVDRLKVQAWRGRPSGGKNGDLVAFVAEATCADGMSDAKRPYTARVSLADGRLLTGCCRPATLLVAPSGTAAATSATPTPAAPPGAPASVAAPSGPASADAPADWTANLEEFLPALRACTFEALRTEAVVFAEHRPNNSVHLVLRLPEKRYADCEAPPFGPARINRRDKNSALSPAEKTSLLTLLPGSPPRGSCDKSEPAFDDKGNPFGWLTRKGC